MRLWNAGAIALASGILTGCSNPTGISPEHLEGTWIASEYVFTSQADPSRSVDWVSVGASFTLTARADGTFTTTLREPDQTVDTDSGTVSVTGRVLTIAESGQGSPTSFDAVRDGDLLTLTDRNEDFDFDDDAVEDDATLRIVLRR